MTSRGDVLADLVRALDLFGVERMPDMSYVALTSPPAWLAPVLSASAGRPFSFIEAFPFLDAFLRDASVMWHRRTTSRLVSGAFVVPAGGDEILVRAIALGIDERAILVLDRLHGDADPRPLLQRARERALVAEQLSRQAIALRAAAATAADLARQLAESELDPAQRALAERVHATLANVLQAAASDSSG